MFLRATIPSDLPKSLPNEVTTALKQYEQAAEISIAARSAQGIGDADLQKARDADRALMLEALKAGNNIEKVGTPNESAFHSKREAYRSAQQLADGEASRVTFETAAVLDEHKASIVTAFATEAQAASESYCRSIAHLLEMRTAVERSTNRLQWATSISPTSVPHIQEDHGRSLRVRAGDLHTDSLGELLSNDAAMSDTLLKQARALAQAKLDEQAAIERQQLRVAQVTADSLARREQRL